MTFPRWWYRLDGHTPVPTDRVEAAFGGDRTVARDEPAPDVTVSTVFLGLDHGHGLSQEPVLFETMVFGGELDGEQWRYCTWDEAEAGHRDVVARIKAP